MTREALLWKKLNDKTIQCNVCHNRCVLKDGEVARCLSRCNENGEMKLMTYGVISSLAVDPIEKKPLYHFHSGTNVLSAGSYGCNFRCLHCQNWQISQIHKEKVEQFLANEPYLSPENFVDLVEKHGCKGIAWTYNEPCIWLEYAIDSAKLAKEKGYYTAYVTNGFQTNEALELIAPYLDAYRVDLKSFEDKFYQIVCGVRSKDGVYQSTLKAKELGMHIECVTNIIPTFNDSDENLKNIASWIKDNLGEETVWHVTRFFPYHKLDKLPPTPIEKIENAVKIGKEVGLKHIYMGNV